VALAGAAKGAAAEAVMAAVREAALAATDFAWLGKGDAVWIKPVVNSGNAYPATTDPLALRAVAGLLKERGAGRVIVSDMSGIESVKLGPNGLERGSTRALMEKCGLLAAAREAGAEVYLPEEEGWDAFIEEPMKTGPSWKAGLMMPKRLQEADHIVLLPRTGRHVLAGSTLGLKAAVGYWRTDTRLEYHRDGATLQEKTAEANTAMVLLEKQRLVLTSATRVLTTFGPDNGFIAEPETGLVIASTSIVAHDMVSLAWLLLNREAVPEKIKRNPVKDPNGSPFMAASGNRLVVSLLGGAREAARSEKLAVNGLNRIGDDRVLTRAAEIFGAPAPRLEPAGGVPADLLAEIARRAAF
jgi:uncharacterized protein (DUF362 family)